MPINPRIALGVEPGPAPYTPMELEQQRLTLGRLGRQEQMDQQQMELNQQRISEGKQRQAENAAMLERAGKVRSVLEKHQGDIEKALPELWSLDPAAADRFETHIYDRKKREYDTKKLELEQAGTRAKRLAEIAGTATDQPSLRRALGMAASEKLLTPEQIAELGDTWDDNTAAAVKQFRMQALDVSKQLDEARKTDEHAWKKAEEDRKKAAETRAQRLHVASLPSKTADPKTGLTPAQAANLQVQKDRTSMQDRHNRAVEAKADTGQKQKAQEVEQLADAVIANPAEYDRLTPTTKAALLPVLNKRGFTGFGKPLSDSAITKLNEFQAAIAEVEQLRKDIAANPGRVGPVAGLQALNPWSKSRELQAKVDLVRQRVGKALEGGVLRKEDEEKYKKILATLRDTPATADAKLDNLIKSLNLHLDNYVSLQKTGGRRTDAPATPKENDPLEIR